MSISVPHLCHNSAARVPLRQFSHPVQGALNVEAHEAVIRKTHALEKVGVRIGDRLGFCETVQA